MKWQVLPKQEKHSPLTYRPDIDGLRAIAVLAVVAFHAFPQLIRGGFVGVDVFFVISGFLISSIIFKELEHHRFSFADFYSRRIRRIFPSLSIVLIFVLVAGWFLLLPEGLKTLGKHVTAGALFASNLAYLSESGYFDTQSELKPLLHLWSLGIEEQFYIVWPALLVLFWRFKKRLSVLLLFGLVVSFALNILTVGSHRDLAFYSPLSRFWELLMGAWLALGTNRELPFFYKFRHTLSILGFASILYGVVSIHKGITFPGWNALFPAVGSLLIIAAGPQAVLNKNLLSKPFMVTIGLISYPLYLWHWVLLVFLRVTVLEPSFTQLSLALVVSVLMSWLTYQFIETPVRFSKSRQFVVQGLLVSIGTLGIIGALFYWNQGFPSRLPEEIREIATLKRESFDWEAHVRSGHCHLYDPAAEVHPDECIEKSKPLIVLWGDSYAGALYPGLRAAQKQIQFGIGQLTSAACPPVANIQYSGHRDNCDSINERILSQLPNIKPDIILLHTTWQGEHYSLSQERYNSLIEQTLDRIHKAVPEAKVVVIGPVPMWEAPLQECLARYYLRHQSLVGDRMNFCLRKGLFEFDQRTRAFFEKRGIKYVAPLDSLCSKDGCMVRVGPGLKDLESIDGGHISSATSEFLIQHLMPQILN